MRLQSVRVSLNHDSAPAQRIGIPELLVHGFVLHRIKLRLERCFLRILHRLTVPLLVVDVVLAVKLADVEVVPTYATVVLVERTSTRPR